MKRKYKSVPLRILLLLTAILLSSTTLASDYSLTNNRWALLSVPANSTAQTIEQLFGDDLPASAYTDTWAIFTFDQQSQSYVIPTLNSTLAPGDGFWMVQDTGTDVTIDIPADLPEGNAQLSTGCATTDGCFSIQLLTSATAATWSVLGAPYSAPIDVSQISVLSSTGTCSQGCDLAQAKSEGLLIGEQWAYDAASGNYNALSTISDLQPWQGFWLQAAATADSTVLNVLIPKPEISNNANIQGLHTSLNELASIRNSAIEGNTQYQQNIDRIAATANEAWPYGDVGTPFTGTPFIDNVYDKNCVKRIDPQSGGILPEAGSKIFAKVLAYILTENVSYAEQAKNIILDFADSSGFDTVIDGSVQLNGANQCALEIAFFTPLLIDSALLLEAYPDWTAADKAKVQSWLATQVYPVTSAIARTRKNNWGTAAAFASWSIGHYLSGSALLLNEVYPDAISFSAEQAKDEHVNTQLDIIGNSWAGDTQCENFGFQSHGGYPDELRRGSTGCDGTYLFANDLSYSYQITTMNHLIYHAEALRRHSDNELYQYKLNNGESLMLKGITFVIDNPNGTSYDWRDSKLSTLRIANSYLNDVRLCEQLSKGTFFREGRFLPYSKLTYPTVCQ